MKKIFECSNGIEFFSNGESILGYLPKEEAIDFVNSIIIEAQKSEEKEIAQFESILLKAINKSYIQLPKADSTQEDLGPATLLLVLKG